LLAHARILRLDRLVFDFVEQADAVQIRAEPGDLASPDAGDFARTVLVSRRTVEVAFRIEHPDRFFEIGARGCGLSRLRTRATLLVVRRQWSAGAIDRSESFDGSQQLPASISPTFAGNRALWQSRSDSPDQAHAKSAYEQSVSAM
jgi:hypothetical protein